MIEKLAGSIAAVLAIILGIWARVTFVRRSEIYGGDGRPVYMHAASCRHIQNDCRKLICTKIDEIKKYQESGEIKRDAARAAIQTQLSEIQKFMGRVDQYIKDHQ